MFRTFGHDDVSVLDGGLPKWKAEGRPLADLPDVPRERHLSARFNSFLVRDADQIKANISKGKEQVLDARSAGRFNGTDPEPREGLRSGHIPNSLNLPFQQLFGEGGAFKDAEGLRAAFDGAGVDLEETRRDHLWLGRHRLHPGAWPSSDRSSPDCGVRWQLDRVGRPGRPAGKPVIEGAPEPSIPITITHLEMTEQPRRQPPPPPAIPHAVMCAEKITVAYSRFLYNTVGEQWTWSNRRWLTDGELAETVQAEGVETYVLYVRGTPAGYTELDFRELPEVAELSYFGLMPTSSA